MRISDWSSDVCSPDLLIAGWLFGRASHPGGRKWRARYEAEREAHAAYREQTEARIDALQRENAALGHDRVAVPADPRPIDAPARGPWLGARESNDLTRNRGIDATLADRLRVAGIGTFAARTAERR